MDLNNCLPIINGTELYGKYKGKLLAAIHIDGNNQFIPLASEDVLDTAQWREYNDPRLIVDASRVRTKGRLR